MNSDITSSNIGKTEKKASNSPWLYLGLLFTVIGFYLWPNIFGQIPFGYLYLNTDVPLQVTGIQYEICPECFVQDVHFNGELRLFSEREFIYPTLAKLSQLIHLDVIVSSGLIGLILNIIIVFAVFLTLWDRTKNKFWSFIFSTLFIFGFQIFAGIWLGGFIGGYNTHSIAIALGFVIFGAFLKAVNNKNEKWIYSVFIVTALLVNIYAVVFTHLLVIMTLCVAWQKTLKLKNLLVLCVVCILLMPLPFFEVLRIHGTGLLTDPDTKVLTPYISLESPQYFIASARRFLVPIVLLFAFWFFQAKLKSNQVFKKIGNYEQFENTLMKIIIISAILTFVAILLENYSYFFFMFQGASGFSQFLFLALFYLVVIKFLDTEISIGKKGKIILGFALYIFILVGASNIIYTIRHQADWLKNSERFQNRVELYRYIKNQTPIDSKILSPVSGISMEIRGFALRSIVIADKDKGGLTQGYEARQRGFALTERIKEAYKNKDMAELQIIAEETHATHILYPSEQIDHSKLSDTQIIFQNKNYALAEVKP
ncbi:MAG: hypothetical protein BWY14_00559 [Parcubacteria group bacterium ADurb.Bin192]|nr:MAG: hypothetical protein BWY14_00559 [Parcubacteria group bacterium ADurb.Bin192]